MKRFFLAALAIAAIASCAKNEVNEVADNSQITFQTVVGPNTKALIDGVEYATTDPSFGTFAYYNDSETSFPASSTDYIPESQVSYQTSAWTTSTPYYWPKNGSLTFFSYSPYSINGSVNCNTTNGIVISDWDVDANGDVDVMVADVETGLTMNGSNGAYTGVPTVFRHKLSQVVNVTFKTDIEYNDGAPYAVGEKQFFINYVKFNKLEQTGTYTSGNNVDATNLGLWTLPSPASYVHTYDWFSETASCDKEFKSATPANTKTYLLLMPQTYVDDATPANVSNVEIKYTIRTFYGASTDGTTNYSDDVVTTSVSMYDIFSAVSNTLAMNKKVTLNFTIGVDQIYWAPSVATWGTETGAATIN